MAIMKALACASLLAFAFAAQPVFAQTSSDTAPAPANGAPAAASPAAPGSPAAAPVKKHRHRKANVKKPTVAPTPAPASPG